MTHQDISIRTALRVTHILYQTTSNPLHTLLSTLQAHYPDHALDGLGMRIDLRDDTGVSWRHPKTNKPLQDTIPADVAFGRQDCLRHLIQGQMAGYSNVHEFLATLCCCALLVEFSLVPKSDRRSHSFPVSSLDAYPNTTAAKVPACW